MSVSKHLSAIAAGTNEAMVISTILVTIGKGDIEVCNATLQWLGERLSSASTDIHEGMARIRMEVAP